MWAILALGAALLTSFNPILYKRLVRETSPVVVMWGVIGLALPLLALNSFVLTSRLPQMNALFFLAVVGSATLNALAHLASARSLRLADASLVTPLLTFSPVFTLFISTLFLGEVPDVRGLIGVAFVLAGAYWLSRGPDADWLTPFKSVTLKPGVTLVLLAGVLWAITPILEKFAIQHTLPKSPRLTALAVNGLWVVLLTPFALREGRAPLAALVHRRHECWLAALIAGVAPRWATQR